ncbi:hypothetical protein BT96DRAFT_922728 [Gymnopus androsaceus JB14]|uniref:Monopolin complex subunit Csm1/Pcs1 C-terminal domain-containing protein n=1 Tax=Gymnopus androsaceus JB14 TaxID=1447944 RepID=A0A6A4HD84_9AGAR|nr:hypothetical protein BT96DRAFT_922728 [Gymnopus androsaceus JB14]
MPTLTPPRSRDWYSPTNLSIMFDDFNNNFGGYSTPVIQTATCDHDVRFQDPDRKDELGSTTAKPKTNEGKTKANAPLHFSNLNAEQAEELREQFEKCLWVRETENDALMRVKKEQCGTSLSTLKPINAQLTPAGSGTGSALRLLMHEAVNEEKSQLEQEVLKWRQQLEEMQKVLEEKEQRVDELNYELQATKHNYQTLLDEWAVQRPRLQVIRLYEEFTHLYVTGIESQPGLYGDDWKFRCVFTYGGEKFLTGPTDSLSFTLATHSEKVENDESQRMMHYEPVQLDEMTTRSLGHLDRPFFFERDQLPLFLGSIYNTLEEAS